MNKEKIREFLKRRSSKIFLAFFALAVIALIINLLCLASADFADIFNRLISSPIRAAMAAITGILPFSLGETLIVSIPVWTAVILFFGIRATSKRKGGQYIFGLSSFLALLYAMFVLTSTAGYNGKPLAVKLGLSDEPITATELRDSAFYMIEKMNEELDGVEFLYASSSVMPYSLDEMNALLLDAYESLSEKYEFIPKMWSRIKPIALSEPMSYTHITGIYTYYTGEANLNINFPDYTLPFTAAHELAHQRGILPENEANFVAFLVCCEADDPYIRYSGYLNMYEYLSSALYSASYEFFREASTALDIRVKYEMYAYSLFFDKYSQNTVADISSAVNDTYLKLQGETEGERSYGMVVDLAAAYVKEMVESHN